jgi:RNase P subunit RPR2
VICAKCRSVVTGETAAVGSPMCAGNGYPDDYLLLITCRSCGATHSIRMWQSESAALDDAEEEERRAA